MMYDRNGYGNTPYGSRGATAPRRPADVRPAGYSYAPQQAQDPYAPTQAREPYDPPQQRYVQQRRQPSGGYAPRQRGVDMLILIMMFIAGPLCGLLGVFFRPMLWIFLGVEGLSLLLMWLLRCFMLRGRIVLSCLMLVLMTLALLAGINIGAKPDQFQSYGSPADAQSVAVQQTKTPWDAVSGVGLGGLTSDANAPVEVPVADAPVDTSNLAGEGTTITAEAVTATEPYSADGQVFPTASAGTPMSSVLQAAEAVLTSYLQNWQQQNWENMVQYTTPTWRSAQTNPQLQLYWNHAIWLLNSWTMTAQNAEMNADSITFSVLTDLSKNTSTGEAVTKRFDALVLKVDDTWYVDPDSMRNGIVVTETADAMAEANAAALEESGADESQVVSSSSDQTSGTDPNLELWYNSDGGSFYHLLEHCESIGAEYYDKMQSFTYSQLSDSPYDKLKPCKTCGAPDRP